MHRRGISSIYQNDAKAHIGIKEKRYKNCKEIKKAYSVANIY